MNWDDLIKKKIKPFYTPKAKNIGDMPNYENVTDSNSEVPEVRPASDLFLNCIALYNLIKVSNKPNILPLKQSELCYSYYYHSIHVRLSANIIYQNPMQNIGILGSIEHRSEQKVALLELEENT